MHNFCLLCISTEQCDTCIVSRCSTSDQSILTYAMWTVCHISNFLVHRLITMLPQQSKVHTPCISDMHRVVDWMGWQYAKSISAILAKTDDHPLPTLNRHLDPPTDIKNNSHRLRQALPP